MKMFFGDLVLFKIVVYMNYVVIYFDNGNYNND